jgi:hypothetical protein
MRTIRCVCAAVVVAGALVGLPVPADAQENVQALRQGIDQLRREFDAMRQDYGQRLAALEAKLAAAEAAAPATPATPPPPAPPPAVPEAATPAQPTPAQPTAQIPPGAEGAGGPSGALPVYGAAVGAGSKIFNPDIAVIGDFLGAAGHNEVNPGSPLELHESEASFQAVVDPYARADFFISFGQEGVEVEEGYLTFNALPGGLLTKVGKMRAAFGKVNTMHNHILPWTDRPLVTENLVGGEEGISDAGISVARLITNPWFFLEATGQVFAGNSGDLFHADDRTDLTYVAHLRGYHDVTEDSNLDFGFSFAHGNSPSGAAEPQHFKANLYGIDATYRWRPLQRSIYRSFIGRAEWVWTRREVEPDLFATPRGMYVSGDYQFARRWTAGGRYDRSQSLTSGDDYDTGGAAVLTFRPSEFSQVRGQYRHINYVNASSANELLFQFQFSIGAHGAHPF